MNGSTPGRPVHHQLPEFTQTHVHRVGDVIQPFHPLSSLLLLPPIPPSIRVFSNESTLRMRWPKYWSFSFSISPSNEHPGLIFFRWDWLDLLAVQGTLKSLLQHHSSKASILRRSAFFTAPYSTINKDFPGGPVVKNLPPSAGSAGLIPGQRTKIPHALGQLSPFATQYTVFYLASFS